MAMLMMIHPETGDVASLKKGDGHLAVDLYRSGYRALTERTNKRLEELANTPAHKAA